MALHYKLRFLLQMQTLLSEKPLNQLSPQEARKAQKKGFERLNPFINFAPEALYSIQDQAIAVEKGNILLRIYRPTAQTDSPMLMFFHGGGFVLSDLDTHHQLCTRLAYLSQAVVIAVDYRLAPEHPYPTALEDCYQATLWAYQNALNIGANPENIALAGDSAGGAIATIMAMMLRDRQAKIRPKAQVLLYPTLDATFGESSINELAEGYLLTRELTFWFYEQYLPPQTDRTHPYISPLLAKDLTKLPPALIITAEFDLLKDEGKKYAQRLLAAGVPTIHSHYLGMIHIFAQMPRLLPQAQEAQQQIVRFLKKHWD